MHSSPHLSIRAGLVSPQFHVMFDDYLKSIKWVGFMPRFKWQYTARQVKENQSSTPDLDKETITRMINRSPQNNPSFTINRGEDTSNQGDQDYTSTQGDQEDTSTQDDDKISLQEANDNKTGDYEETD